jgi:hypothetical protein
VYISHLSLINIYRLYNTCITKSSGYVIEFLFFLCLILLFIQGRAALISGPKRQSIHQKPPTTNRPIAASTTSASSPSFSNIEHIRSYSLSRAQSDQTSRTSSGSSTPTTSRRTSASDTHDKSRRSLTPSNMIFF